jgi:hypothetical protein
MDFASSQTAASLKFGGVVRGGGGLFAAAKAHMLAESAGGGVCGEGKDEAEFAQAAYVEDQGKGHEIGGGRGDTSGVEESLSGSLDKEGSGSGDKGGSGSGDSNPSGKSTIAPAGTVPAGAMAVLPHNSAAEGRGGANGERGDEGRMVRQSYETQEQKRFRWLRYRKKNLRKEVYLNDRDHYIRSQAAVCIQQWFRLEVLGFHLDPCRAADKKEARRKRTARLRQNAIIAACEQAAFEKTSEWYQSLFDVNPMHPLATGRELAKQAEAERKCAKERQEILKLRRMKSNQGRILRLKALQPRLYIQRELHFPGGGEGEEEEEEEGGELQREDARRRLKGSC